MGKSTKVEPKLYNVIQFESFKIGRNRSLLLKGCSHSSLMLDDATNRVVCRDCDEILDPFWALQKVVTDLSRHEEKIQRSIEEARQIQSATVHLRAAKKIETILRSRKLVPVCPHCEEAILADEFLNIKSTNKDGAVKRRIRGVPHA